MTRLREIDGRFREKPTVVQRITPVVMLVSSALFCLWLSNPLVPTRIYGQNPIDLKLSFKSPIVINFSKLEWSKPEQELISPLVFDAQAKEEVVTPTPTPDPYRVPAGFPAPKSEVQMRTVKAINEVWGVDAELGVKLAFCESGYGSSVENQISSARGVYQFLKATWIGERKRMNKPVDLALRFDIQENVETGYSHFKRNGLEQPWRESLNCINSSHVK